MEPAKAAAKADYDRQVYYFCSAACHKAFTEEPQKYAGSTPTATRHRGHFRDLRKVRHGIVHGVKCR